MESKSLKSVITCDMEGRIETYGKDAAAIFGYTADEVIGKKRVSLFSPGLIVLEHVTGWLKTASEKGSYQGQTVFVRKDGTLFAADVTITPTYRKGKQIGYCGVTVPRPDIPVSEATPPINLFTRVFAGMVVTRAPFLTATIMPILIGAAWVASRNLIQPFPWLYFVMAMVGGIALHIAANTYNDYFDWTSGTDGANNDYFLPLSGGSRSIELGLITEKRLFSLATVSLVIASIIGILLAIFQGPGILLFGLAGAFSAYFYTAPPLRLVARKGIGELLIGLNFGPLMVAGTVYALTGTAAPIDFLVGAPIGLLITAVLWINQFPDYASDRAMGKHNLVVVLGKEAARWGYAVIVFGAFALIGVGVALGWFPAGALLMLIGLPVAVYTTVILFRHYQERSLVRANSGTVALHALAGLALTIGVLAFR